MKHVLRFLLAVPIAALMTTSCYAQVLYYGTSGYEVYNMKDPYGGCTNIDAQSPDFHFTESFTKNSSGYITTETIKNIPTDTTSAIIQHRSFTRNSSNMITKISDSTYKGTTFQNYSGTLFYYNSNNMIDSIANEASAGTYSTYTYNSAGKISNIQMENNGVASRSYFVYNGAGQLTQEYDLNQDSVGTDSSYIYNFYYNNGQVDSVVRMQNNMGNWVTDQTEIYTFFNNGANYVRLYKYGNSVELDSLMGNNGIGTTYNYVNGKWMPYETDKCTVSTGIASVAARVNFSVFPNPFSNEVTIRLGEGVKEVQKITLLNEAGQALQVLTTGTASFGNPVYQFNVRPLSSGIYFIKIESQNGTATRMVMKN